MTTSLNYEFLDRQYQQGLHGAIRALIWKELGQQMGAGLLPGPKQGREVMLSACRTYVEARLPILLQKDEALPALTDLILADIVDYGPIDTYLQIPNLKEIVFKEVDIAEYSLDTAREEKRLVPCGLHSETHFSELFLKIAAELGVRFDQSYPILQRPWKGQWIVEGIYYPAGRPWLKFRKKEHWDAQ